MAARDGGTDAVRTFELTTTDGPMAVYEVRPQTPPTAAVIVLQEAFGVNDHIEDVARRIAAEGYLTVAPALFHRSGSPRLGYDDVAPALPHVAALTRAGLEEDLDVTLAHLDGAGLEPARVATVGFCMGGSVSLVPGVRHGLGATVTFYGGGVIQGRFGEPPLLDLAPELRSPWLGLYGDRDEGIPVYHVEQLREAAARASVVTEVVRYPDAPHGFRCDARGSFHRPAAEDAWRRALAFVGSRIGPASTA